MSLDDFPNSRGLGGAEWDLFCNTLRDPVQQIIAVEVESVAQAKEVLTAARELIGSEKSVEEVRFQPASEDAGDFVGRIESATKKQNKGALVFALAESSPDDEGELFWRRLNLLRERIAAIPGQVIFLLLPKDYRNLTLHADHLKRWISQRIRLRWDVIESDPDSPSSTRNPPQPTTSVGLMPPEEARRVLATMEGQLRDALTRGEATFALVESYYIPLFKAAVALGDIHHSANLLAKIEEHGDSSNPSDSFLFARHVHALAQRDFSNAELLAENLRGRAEAREDDRLLAGVHYQLGRIAQEQRDFAAAENCYKKSLAILEKQGDEHGAASNYHQLGIIAQEQRDFAAAESWYKKSLAIKENQGNEHGAASSFHQLGRIAQEQRDFAAAESWYKKSLAILEKQGDEHGAAISYHQLGRIAETQRNFTAAETWYNKGLTIDKKQGNEHGTATSYQQLGIIAEEIEDPEKAMEFLLKAIAVFQRLDPHNAEITRRSISRILNSCPAEMEPKLWVMAKAELNEEGIRGLREAVEKLRSE